MDPFLAFVKAYEQGSFSEALGYIIRDPESCYETLSSTSPYIQQLANYADSIVFENYLGYCWSVDILHKLLSSPEYHEFYNVLAVETILRRSDDKIIDLVSIDKIHDPFKNLTAEHRQIKKRIEALIIARPELKPLFPTTHLFCYSAWQFIPYNYPLQVQQFDQGDIPLILLEPSKGIDFQAYLEPYRDKSTVLLCETYQHLYSLLRYDAVYQAFLDPKNVVYLMTMHPEFLLQQERVRGSLSPILPRKVTHGKEFFPKLALALQGALHNDNESLTYLYHLTRNWVEYQRSHRLGKSRSLSLHEKNQNTHWYSPYKIKPSRQIDMGFTAEDFVQEQISEAARKRSPRPFSQETKLRLVHIVPQLVDSAHAPSKILRSLINNTDRKTFTPSIIITDIFAKLPLGYPPKRQWSEPSSLRGAHTIKQFKENGVNVCIIEPRLTIEGLAEGTEKKLEEWKADIAVFHGPDEVNNLATASTNTPLRVMFELGTLMEHPGYDCAVLSSEDALKLYNDMFKQLHTDAYALGFSLDLRKTWLPQAKTKQELGFPPDAFLMTTISGHLFDRLDKEMCEAIGKILQRCPNTWYCPMGPLEDNESVIRSRLEPYNINNRVKFLGFQPNASQVARSMDLYLNEFPIGSCLGMLDAMASGCPVVSMYDKNGPQAGRYAGIYFGMDRVVHSLRIEDYVNLACKLINDPQMYKVWSDHAEKMYLEHADEKKYMQAFEKILMEQVKKRR